MKRCVFKRFLKMSRVSDLFTVSGRLFHRTGAAFWKHLSPYVDSLVLGTTSSDMPADLRGRGGSYMHSMSRTYAGARLFSALYVKSRILNSILLDIGSQCNCFNTGVMWSYFRVLMMIRAAVFWIR